MTSRYIIINYLEDHASTLSFNAAAKAFCEQAKAGKLAETLNMHLRKALERHRGNLGVSVRTLYTWKDEVERIRQIEEQIRLDARIRMRRNRAERKASFGLSDFRIFENAGKSS
jgi:hypothetical protein